LPKQTVDALRKWILEDNITSNRKLLIKVNEAKLPQITNLQLKNLKIRLKNEKTNGKYLFIVHTFISKINNNIIKRQSRF